MGIDYKEAFGEENPIQEARDRVIIALNQLPLPVAEAKRAFFAWLAQTGGKAKQQDAGILGVRKKRRP